MMLEKLRQDMFQGMAIRLERPDQLQIERAEVGQEPAGLHRRRDLRQPVVPTLFACLQADRAPAIHLLRAVIKLHDRAVGHQRHDPAA